MKTIKYTLITLTAPFNFLAIIVLAICFMFNVGVEQFVLLDDEEAGDELRRLYYKFGVDAYMTSVGIITYFLIFKFA
jgi:hypothetical protein